MAVDCAVMNVLEVIERGIPKVFDGKNVMTLCYLCTRMGIKAVCTEELCTLLTSVLDRPRPVVTFLAQ